MSDALDREYSPSHYARDVAATLARQAAMGRQVVERHAPCRLGYGDDPLARLDLFVPRGDGPWPLMAFIHGGYWQELDHTATDFLAERYLARGMAFASLGYGLAPATSIETMGEQCARGLAEARTALDARGGVDAVTLGGHSAGAQLACRVADEAGKDIDALLLVSGVYDLTPLVDTYVNVPLSLDPAQARALSPLFGELTGLPPSRVLIAEHDSPAFRRQGRDFVSALNAAGGRAELVDLPDCDHFDILDHL
ncbi:alpha/beta hydrolase [Halomonas caseinilytica]|uniref:Arylformamidase n=1 Tax=Halomonas caseinilytica TaxID=438744 RepID=A0A1M6V3P4_9GAMM|nr:alpha/beta hydrolase [Halomonas caseinilytica]SHK76073.1 arylformamidase [Halomonas caseinilytica]